MKDITTKEAVKILKDFSKYGLYHNENTKHKTVQAIEKVLNELEKYKELYVRTLGHTLNNSITQRDKAKDDLEALNEGWKIECEKKNKIINAMALQLSGITIWDNKKEEPRILKTEEEVKKYYEGNVENDYEENYKSISNN